MRLTSLRIKNYGCLADFELTEIPPLAIFVGANGSGKSTLFDIFAFLRDALRDDIPTAVANRGGFHTLRTRNATAPIQIELHTPALTYTLSIDNTPNGPYAHSEQMRIATEFEGVRWEFVALDTDPANGEDIVAPRSHALGEQHRTERLWLDQPDSIVWGFSHSRPLRALDPVDEHNRRSPMDEMPLDTAFEMIADLRRTLRNSYFSCIDPALAKQSSSIANGLQLSERGENLANVARHVASEDSAAFDQSLAVVKGAVPGLAGVRTTKTIDERVVLEFLDQDNDSGILAPRASDGTIKLLAYALLLNEPQRHPLLCIEEPENYLYPKLLWPLIEEIREYSENDDTQVLVSTHSPDLVDAADPDEVFWLVKKDGATKAFRVSDDPQLVDEHDFGGQLGFMWRTGSFKGAHPS